MHSAKSDAERATVFKLTDDAGQTLTTETADGAAEWIKGRTGVKIECVAPVPPPTPNA